MYPTERIPPRPTVGPRLIGLSLQVPALHHPARPPHNTRPPSQTAQRHSTPIGYVRVCEYGNASVSGTRVCGCERAGRRVGWGEGGRLTTLKRATNGSLYVSTHVMCNHVDDVPQSAATDASCVTNLTYRAAFPLCAGTSGWGGRGEVLHVCGIRRPGWAKSTYGG